jgi:outer membrane protein TolC
VTSATGVLPALETAAIGKPAVASPDGEPGNMCAPVVRHRATAARCLAFRRLTATSFLLASSGSARAVAQISPRAESRAEAHAAAAPAAVEPLRLGDIYAAVRQHNPRAAAARSLADAARARIPGSRTPPDPQLQLGFMNYDIPGLRPMDPLGMTQLQLMQMVPTAGKLGLSGRITTARAAAEQERATDVEWELRSQSAMAYYEVFEAEQAVAIATETRRLLEDIAAVARTMYQVGEGRQADVLRAQVGIARMTEEVTRMEAMRVAAAARLNALLDRPVDTPVPAMSLPRFPDAVSPVDSLAALAALDRPMIRAGEEEVRAAEAMTTLARRELIPDLVVGVQYGQRSGEMGTERMGSLMLGASVPIFAGRRQLRMREEAAAMRAMAQADLAFMRADTRGRVGEAHATLTRARNLARLYLTTVLPQAEATVASALAAYRVGSVDFMTLLDDRMTVNDYRRQLVSLRAEEGRAWAELETLVGRELFDPYAAALASAVEGRDRP